MMCFSVVTFLEGLEENDLKGMRLDSRGKRTEPRLTKGIKSVELRSKLTSQNNGKIKSEEEGTSSAREQRCVPID